MMTASELKTYIFKNGKVEFLLESLGCHHIVYHDRHEVFSAAFPDGDNPNGIHIRNNAYLDYRSFSRGVAFDEHQDFFDLVQYITDSDFSESFRYLHKLLGLQWTGMKPQTQTQEQKKNPLSVFRRAKTKTAACSGQEVQFLSDVILESYVPRLHIDWFREGIMPWTRNKFGIMFSYERSRIIIPMRHWKTGQLMGTNARTTVPEYELLGIKKYFITPSYQKHLNLYGLYENRQSIEEKHFVVVVESEKSVLKRDSRFDSTLVALSGHSMSRFQYGILYSLDVREVVIAMDKDVPIEEVWHMCEFFYKKRIVSFIDDCWGLLGEKDSPADADDKTYRFLLDNRVKYTQTYHEKYLRYVNEFKHKQHQSTEANQ